MTQHKAESMDSANETITIIPKKSKMVKKSAKSFIQTSRIRYQRCRTG